MSLAVKVASAWLSSNGARLLDQIAAVGETRTCLEHAYVDLLDLEITPELELGIELACRLAESQSADQEKPYGGDELVTFAQTMSQHITEMIARHRS